MLRLAPVVLIVASTLPLLGCDDESDPVDVPFEGIDPASEPDRVKPMPKPTASAEDKPEPKPKARPNQLGVSKVQTCCAALRAAAKRATDEGTRAVNEQAARLCSSQAQQVRVGRTTSAKALSAVRGSLLTKAPAACR